MVWCNAKFIQLIQLYEKEKVLWDPRCQNYYNKNMKQDAWRKLSETLGENIEEVKKKMNGLLGSYRREKSREKKSLVTGSGADDIYKSKWFGYDYFHFLADKFNPHDNVDTMFTEESQEAVTQLQNATRSQDETQSQDATQSRKMSKRKEDSMLTEAMEILRNSSKTINDPLISYGTYISNELRKYDSMTVANIKHAINNIMYQADLGYNTNANQQYGYYTESPGSTTSSSSFTFQDPSLPFFFVRTQPRPYPPPPPRPKTPFQLPPPDEDSNDVSPNF